MALIRDMLARLHGAIEGRGSNPGATRMRVEPLEARLLYSADLGPGLLDAPAAMPQAEHRELDAAGEYARVAHADHGTAAEIVFVDAATPDYQAIVDDIRASGRNIEVILLSSERDGIAQIGDALAGRNGVEALHFISHGSDGLLRLGNASLDGATLSSRAGEIAGWSSALSAEADILLYGCDVAATHAGEALVAGLAQLTGADVAASIDRTGAATQGGDWDLEHAVGRIDAGIAVSTALRAQWTGVLANASPVLSGAEDLAPVTEDPAANPGTLVADLIAGHATDADAGALAGIAVTGVDNTNGTWQYSTDGGGSWSAFGTPSDTAARLLAADAGTYVRFVPNADWNGTVANGLTFRAWDQTSGAAGGLANTLTTTSTVLDRFTAVSYANNDGTVAWASSWVDNDGNPSAGSVQVAGGRMQITTLLAGSGIVYREADLTGATSATLSFAFQNDILIGLGGSVTLQISNNGGGSYSSIATFSASDNVGTGLFSTDISAFISAGTRIQFVSAGLAVAQSMYVDDLQISYVTPLASGVTAFSTATASSSVTVSPVNDAPEGADRSIAIVEDTPYTLAVADFGFTDAHDAPADDFSRVVIGALPTTGTLTLDGVAVTAGQSIDIADILAGDLVFTPAAEAAGTAIDGFSFQVQDDGGGADLDPTPNTITFDVTPVDDAPAGTDHTVSLAEDGAYTFSAADFGYTDADVPPHAFAAVTVTSLPAAGTLTLNGVAVTAGQSISVGALGAGQLVFTAAPGAHGAGYATFTFQVESSGGAPNIDPTPNTLSIDVTAVNDPPAGTSATVSTNEDVPYVFSVADFGFSDPDDVPANALLAVRIASLPGAGALTLNGVAVAAGDFVSATDITGGLLVFTPAADASGAGYAAFDFQVQDDGGGSDLDLSPSTLTIDVVAVNDAPALTSNNGLTLAEGGSAGIDAGMLHVSDAESTPSQIAYSIGTAPAHGHLELTTAPGIAITAFTQDDIANNRLVYVHDGSETLSDSFGFTVSDGMGGGVAATTFAIAINGVNDAPTTSAPGAQSTAAGSPLVFSSANGNALALGDIDAGGGLLEVSLASTHGTLTLAGTAGLTLVSGTGAGDASMVIRGTLAAINAALDGLAYAPDAGYAGAASITFSGNDLGNSGAGGALAASASVAVSVLALPAPAEPFDPGPAVLDPVVPPVVANPPLPTGPDPAAADPGAPDPAAEEMTPGESGSTDPSPASDPQAAADTDIGGGRAPAMPEGTRAEAASGNAGRGFNVAYGGADLRYLLGTADNPETTFAGFMLAPADAPLTATPAHDAMNSSLLLDSLDRLREGAEEQSQVAFNAVALTSAASLGLSVGYVLWLLRGGVLVSSVLSSLPAWRFVDPLPILGRLEEDEDDAEPDESLESMVDRTNRAAPGEAQPA